MIPEPILLETVKGNVCIRKAEQEDIAAFSELRRMSLEENPTSFGADISQQATWSEEWASGRINSKFDKSLTILAEINGILVGMATIHRYPPPKADHGAYIVSVFIRSEWRGFGILQAIFSIFEMWAVDLGLVFIKLSVTTTNLAAFTAYKKLGFAVFATEPRVLQVNGIFYDEYWMIKDLDAVD